jgi:hypothetical protein
MGKRILILLSLLLSLFILPLQNSEAGKDRWKSVPGRNGQEWILYDPDSVIYLQKDLVRVWIMDTGKDSSGRKSLEEMNCSHKIIRDIEVVTEKPNKLILHTITPTDWRGIVKESPRGELFKILCR